MYLIRELSAQARGLSPYAFEHQLGPVALLMKPAIEEMQRAALQFQALKTALSTSTTLPLNELLLMLRVFPSLSVFFLKPDAERQNFSIGRDAGRVVVVDEPSVSKSHALIIADDSGSKWSIRDEGSLNGTFVNTEPVVGGQTSITNGDTLTLGDAQLVFLQARTLRSQLLNMQ